MAEAREAAAEHDVLTPVLNRRGFVAALIGSLLYSALGLVIESALERLFSKQ